MRHLRLDERLQLKTKGRGRNAPPFFVWKKKRRDGKETAQRSRHESKPNDLDAF
jgi:hypothetical protein